MTGLAASLTFTAAMLVACNDTDAGGIATTTFSGLLPGGEAAPKPYVVFIPSAGVMGLSTLSPKACPLTPTAVARSGPAQVQVTVRRIEHGQCREDELVYTSFLFDMPGGMTGSQLSVVVDGVGRKVQQQARTLTSVPTGTEGTTG